MRILMVCTGNICRSPVAEAIMREEARKRGLFVDVDSCGIERYHVGEAPDSRSQTSARDRGIEIGHLRARQFSRLDFDSFDVIFAMDRGHLATMADMARSANDIGKIRLMLSVLDETDLKDVPDPYYGNYRGFEEVFDLLHQACTAFLDRQMK
jgi:protein-tyrosine phosphatase